MDDYIKREQALKLIESGGTWGWSKNALYDEIKNLPAADVAPVVHAKRVKTKKHNWKKDIDGKIDLYAWDEGYCEGPFCLECGRSFCIHCEEVHRGKDAVEAKLTKKPAMKEQFAVYVEDLSQKMHNTVTAAQRWI